MMEKYLRVFVFGWLLLGPGVVQARELYSAADGETLLSLKSSLKANWEVLPPVSETSQSDAAADSFWRLRLEPGCKLNAEINFGAAWDMQGLLASPASGSSLLPRSAPGFFRAVPLSWASGSGELTFQQEVDRAWVAYQPVFGNFTLGRQAIGWGRGILFSAVDIFAPFSPLEPDREWRRGVDAARADIRITDNISLDLAAAPGRDPLIPDSQVTWNDSILAGRLRGNLGAWDAEVIGGRRGADRLVGATASLPLGNLEVHGEGAVFAVSDAIPGAGLAGQANWVPKAVIGGSNFFPVGQGLTMAMEYHYSGFGVSDLSTLQDRLADPEYQTRFARGDTQIPGQQAFALQLSYTLSDLISGGLNVLQSGTDGFGVLAPSVQWNFAENVTLLATGLLAYGFAAPDQKSQSQFGNTGPSWLVQIRIYD